MSAKHSVAAALEAEADELRVEAERVYVGSLPRKKFPIDTTRGQGDPLAYVNMCKMVAHSLDSVAEKIRSQN